MIDMAVDKFLQSASAFAPSPHSQRQYRMILRRFAAHTGPGIPTTETILHYYRTLRSAGLSDATISAHDRVLRTFYARAARHHWLPANIMLEIPRPRRPTRLKRAATPETFTAMVAAGICHIITSPHRIQYLRDLTILIWLADTGCRAAETANLTITDLDTTRRLARITGKGRKQRLVPYASITADLLTGWLELRPPGSPYLFPTPGGAALTPSGISQSLHRLALAGHVAHHPHRAHAWRHFAATLMVRNGVNLHDAARILGHSSITVTQNYLHLDADDLRRSHDACGPMSHLLTS